MHNNPLIRLSELGQAPWYDYVTRDLITSGELDRLIHEDGLKGMTTNPTIFEKAVAGSELYDDDIRRLHGEGRTPAEIFEALAVEDVRSACDVFTPVYEESGGIHGLVSLEVSPRLANDTDGTIAEARRLWHRVERPNLMIKIPGTMAGLPAIEQCLADGLNINITLLFSVDRYRQVMSAYFRALRARQDAGQPIDRIASVASFFVSRVDSKVDALLDKTGEGKAIRGKIGIANAVTAYAAFEHSLQAGEWTSLKGARPQRPLWASTSTKDPSLPDIYYIEALVAPMTVNTMPPDTFEAYRDHGHPELRIHTIQAHDQLQSLERAGISLDQVTEELEVEGVDKFTKSYSSLLEKIGQKAEALVGR